MSKIIAFSGKSMVGKTTSALYLYTKYNFKLFAFADHLKDLSGNLFPFTYEQLHGISKDSLYENYDWTPREFLISFGNFMRYWDSNYFINNIEIDPTLENIAIHDLRYLNEANFLKSKGSKLVRIERDRKYLLKKKLSR